MIVDSSALIALVMQEAERDEITDTMLTAPSLKMSAATWFESCSVVDARKWAAASARFETLVDEFEMEIVPVTAEQARMARTAYQRFGRGQHKAGLNWGDCFAYALAKITGEPLLFKGNDFSQTDIRPALPV